MGCPHWMMIVLCHKLSMSIIYPAAVDSDRGPLVVPTDMDSGAVAVTPPAVHLSQAQLDDLVSAIDSVRDNRQTPSTKGSCSLLSLQSD